MVWLDGPTPNTLPSAPVVEPAPVAADVSGAADVVDAGTFPALHNPVLEHLSVSAASWFVCFF